MRRVSRGTKVGVLAAIGTELLYGFSFVFTKGVTGTIDPFALLGWRFTVALVILLVLAGLRLIKLQITRATLRPLLVLAICQPVIYYIAETYGVMRTTASESGLLISAIPVTTMLTAVALLGSRPARRQVVGICVTLVGVLATVVAGGLNAEFDPLGYLLLFVAIGSYSVYAAFAERYAEISDIDKTFVMVASGALLFSGMALAKHGSEGTLGYLIRLPLERPDFAVAIGFLALGSTVGAFFLQNVAIGTLGSTRYSTFIGLSTLAALTSAAIVLGERLTLAQLAGGVAILAGVYIANRPVDRTRDNVWRTST